MCFKGCISGRVVKSSLWGEATLATTSGLLPGATFNDVCYNTFQIIHYWAWVLYSFPWYASVGWQPMKEYKNRWWERMGSQGCMLFVSLIFFLGEKYHVIKTDGAFRTQFRSNIVCKKSNKWSVHNLEVTLCVNTTQWEHCVSTHGRYPVQIC